MASSTLAIDTQHEDMIHDSQFDYYAKRLATCSSDRTIRIFDVNGDVYNQSAVLTGHDGPVWEIAWGHPKFGTLLASCSYDGQVIIHREASANVWQKAHVHRVHEASVNSIAWAPAEYGLILACASSDGKVSILEHVENDTWRDSEVINNDNMGCNSVSWAPYSALGSMTEDGRSVKRLATASCTNQVLIWRRGDNGWERETIDVAQPHSDWVRDVAWAPNTGLPYDLLASCSEDGSVFIWTQGAGRPWANELMHRFDAPVWRVSWSITGNVLAVSTGDHKVTLWKQAVDGSWVQITSLEESAEGESR